MKFLKQFLIILGFSFAGELLHRILPFPVPASIYGMGLLFFCLLTRLLPAGAVRETGLFLIEIMPVMFIPAGVGLMTSWDRLQPILVPVAVITVITSLTVMLASGWVSQLIIRKRGGRHHE